MRPPRLVIALSCFLVLPVVLTFCSLLYSHPRHKVATESTTNDQRRGIKAFFSFHTPSSLFPPSAIISLTDDNSTFFLARPAAFGPLLPSDGLSGQLWVGSGFGDDGIGRGGAASGVEGELGCSDVPGWKDGNKQHHGEKGGESASTEQSLAQSNSHAATAHGDEGKQRRAEIVDGSSLPAKTNAAAPHEDDGTDDHLHHPLPGSQVSKPTKIGQSAQYDTSKDGHPPGHADIQSLQESAEISGKVVLLSRGGCGFLEKAKWVQRRGGSALIVGDDTRGGALVTMYARGDTSNVTIPALFTSHTTAHLLSSLIPPGGSLDDIAPDDNQRQGSSDDRFVSAAAKKKSGAKAKLANEGPTFTPTNSLPTNTPRPKTAPNKSMNIATKNKEKEQNVPSKQGWLSSLASAFRLGGRSASSQLSADSRRPPSSGRINWVISESWSDDSPSKKQSKAEPKKLSKPEKSKPNEKLSSHQNSGDGFVIGVQDWRDPDLVAGAKHDAAVARGDSRPDSAKPTTSSSKPISTHLSSSEQKSRYGLKGGSITPGSGEYEKPKKAGANLNTPSDPKKDHASSAQRKPKDTQGSQNGWLGSLTWDPQSENPASNIGDEVYTNDPSKQETEETYFEEDGERDSADEHEGLWVTLTPTTMSTSPFFDTLLVLVVSPLVTLTVVYALLLLRSRIRRRRWRAPKSVVDRLPVRTYHTMSCSSSATSSQVAASDASSPSSPLLQACPHSVVSRTRPRSRTTSGIGENVSASLDKATAKVSLSKGPIEKKKYTGKQVECVVCLEEYIDGQSRVMSLPCGHEFHAECM